MKATELTLRVADEITSVSATVLVTTDGKEVARVPALVPVRGSSGAQSGPGAVAIKPSALVKTK